MNKLIKTGWLIAVHLALVVCLVTLFISQGKSSQGASDKEDSIAVIEEHLKMARSVGPNIERLDRIKQHLDSAISYTASLHTYRRRDTIRDGEYFETVIIPVRGFAVDRKQVAVVHLGDSVLEVPYGQSISNCYHIKTKSYKKGENLVRGEVKIGPDSYLFESRFYVK